MVLSDRILRFLKDLHINNDQLPDGVRAMNPYISSVDTWQITQDFYRKFYSDNRNRRFIIGINPGRFGAGATGVAFTDTKRLENECNISSRNISTHETSSVFVYEVIKAYGGPDKFYNDFYINSVSPLGFVKINKKGREINYNYYDDKQLQEAVWPFIKKTLREQISLGLNTDEIYCLGTGKNFKALNKLNKEENLFREIIPLEHPRYIMQYRNKQKVKYVEKYLDAFG